MRFASCYIAVCECLREESDLQRLVLEVAEDAAKSGHMVTMVKRWHRAESKRMTWESRPWAWGLWMRWFLSIKFQLLCGFQHFKCNIMQHGSVLQSQSEQYQLPKTVQLNQKAYVGRCSVDRASSIHRALCGSIWQLGTLSFGTIGTWCFWWSKL